MRGGKLPAGAPHRRPAGEKRRDHSATTTEAEAPAVDHDGELARAFRAALDAARAAQRAADPDPEPPPPAGFDLYLHVAEELRLLLDCGGWPRA